MKTIGGIIVAALAFAAGGILSGIPVAGTVAARQQAAYGTLKDFFRQPAWLRFKTFWRGLWQRLPRGELRLSPDKPSLPARTMTREQHNKFLTDFSGSIKALEAAGLPPRDLEFLINTVNARYWGIFSITRFSHMTRMVPPPYEAEKGQSLLRLERQLVLLDGLRTAGKISTAEFAAGLDSVRQDILNIDVIRIVEKEYGRFWYLTEDQDARRAGLDPADRYLRIISLHFARLKQYYEQKSGTADVRQLAELEKKYRKVTMELEEFKKRIPRYSAMINDLEG